MRMFLITVTLIVAICWSLVHAWTGSSTMFLVGCTCGWALSSNTPILWRRTSRRK